MTFKDELFQALGRQRQLLKHRTDRLPVVLLAYAIWTVGFGSFFGVLAGVRNGSLGAASWWREELPANMLISLCVMAMTWMGYRIIETLAPQRWLDRISCWKDWRTGTFYSLLSAALALSGVVLGLSIVDRLWTLSLPLADLLSSAAFWRQFLIVSAAISVVMSIYYRGRLRAERLQAGITEAQLKLLQGQIEPHFLFNTLANVQSLIDFDPERAKRMLELFTDYLRSCLVQLRGDTTTLAQEFAMLEAYLTLMQLRMGERLQVKLSLPPELGGVALPPLLAQPLVENAIHHGLEPTIAGGTVAVSARRVEGRLWIEVADDGQGLDGPRRRSGNGVALGNIRARLAARFGPGAGLELLPREGGGTLARIQFPIPDTAP